jgi:hypothetical protein
MYATCTGHEARYASLQNHWILIADSSNLTHKFLTQLLLVTHSHQWCKFNPQPLLSIHILLWSSAYCCRRRSQKGTSNYIYSIFLWQGYGGHIIYAIIAVTLSSTNFNGLDPLTKFPCPYLSPLALTVTLDNATRLSFANSFPCDGQIASR